MMMQADSGRLHMDADAGPSSNQSSTVMMHAPHLMSVGASSTTSSGQFSEGTARFAEDLEIIPHGNYARPTAEERDSIPMEPEQERLSIPQQESRTPQPDDEGFSYPQQETCGYDPQNARPPDNAMVNGAEAAGGSMNVSGSLVSQQISEEYDFRTSSEDTMIPANTQTSQKVPYESNPRLMSESSQSFSSGHELNLKSVHPTDEIARGQDQTQGQAHVEGQGQSRVEGQGQGGIDPNENKLHFDKYSSVFSSQTSEEPRSTGSSESNESGLIGTGGAVKIRQLGEETTRILPGLGDGVQINITNSARAVQIGTGSIMHVHHGAAGATRVTTGRNGPKKQVNLPIPKRMISDDDIDKISTHLGKDWRRLGTKLDMFKGELDAFEHDFQTGGLREIIYQMLAAWREKRGPEALLRPVIEKLLIIKRSDIAKLFASNL